MGEVKSLENIIQEEKKELGLDKKEKILGISLSGGGIRSATFCFGFLKLLEENGLLNKFDYISSVSGGGYINGLIQEQAKKSEKIFTPSVEKKLRENGNFLTPGQTFFKSFFEKFNFFSNFFISSFLHLIWYILFLFFIFSFIFFLGSLFDFLLLKIFGEGLNIKPTIFFAAVSLVVLFLLVIYFYFFHGLRFINRKWWDDKRIFYFLAILSLFFLTFVFLASYNFLPAMNISHVEPFKVQIVTFILALSLIFTFFLFYKFDNKKATFFLILVVLADIFFYIKFVGIYNPLTFIKDFIYSAQHQEILISLTYITLYLLIVIIIGLFADPNILSAHRFYRMRIRDTFLNSSERYLYEYKESKIKVPYPLINSTLNAIGDKKCIGYKSHDLFLLSPLYCGSKLTGYVKTNKTDFKRMTLSTALTISGAALNPMMGYYTSRFLAFIMTIFNLRLGYWAVNPRYYKEKNLFKKFVLKLTEKGITMWPYYNIMELLGKSNLSRLRVNLSDGGHTDNLGAFELLRRECDLVVCIDAGEDKEYKFKDLKNLIQRAKIELGVEISFPENETPEKVIKPNIDGFSKRHFSIGEIHYKNKIGIFVYIKTSLTHKDKKENIKKLECGNKKYSYFDYKIYHPDFPHESTVDQFFDCFQWEAYEKLGEDTAEAFINEINSNEILKVMFR